MLTGQSSNKVEFWEIACSMAYEVLFNGLFYDRSLFRDYYVSFTDSMCAKLLLPCRTKFAPVNPYTM